MARHTKEKPGHIYFNALKKYLTLRNVLLAAIVVVIYLMFSNLAKAIIFIVVFAPLCIVSIKVTRVIPNANVQLITPFTVFLAYKFGWPIGVFFGFFLGLYFWSVAYSISQFVMLEVGLNALMAVISGYFATNMSLDFKIVYFVVMIIQKILYFTLGLAIGGNPVENTIHTASSAISHFILVPPFIFFFYYISNIF